MFLSSITKNGTTKVSGKITMTNEDASRCGSCGAKATLKCTACGTVYYCSKEHQKKHWKVHKKECLPYSEENGPQQGRYLVASRDIPAGHLIFKEKPLAIGPPSSSKAICLGCHSPITSPDYPKCPRCFWPLCSPECANSILHIPECKYLSTDENSHGPPKSIDETPRYDVVLLLRCLALRNIKPDAWKIIEKMVSHSEKYEKEKEPFHMTSVTYITEFLKDVCDVQTAHHVRGAIITNAINTRGPQGQTIRGLYSKIYLLNHSCVPNVTLRADVYSTLYIHAAKVIKKGDPLVFSYVTSAAPLWQRQEELKCIYNFLCKCQRCTDPTELGTHFSNPLCSKCKRGFLEPAENYQHPWTCSDCGESKDLEHIIKVDDEILDEITKSCTSFRDSSAMLQTVLKSYHPKHYVWLRIAQTILGKFSNENDTESLTLRKDIWQQVLLLFFKIEPGLTRRRGVSLFHAACLESEIFKQGETTGKLSPQEQLVAVTKILYLLESAHEIMSLEPPNSVEQRWLRLVNEEISKMKTIREKLEERH
ncbi:hypothetical protein SK128_012619 [Halocaridina rubra]|uniref:Protein msta n=1 Tax=Halocaridina rubra TaxID=373956 RepID=A0AAN8WUW4_HALRR